MTGGGAGTASRGKAGHAPAKTQGVVMGIRHLALLGLPLACAAQAQAEPNYYIDSTLPVRSFTSAEIETVAMPELAYDTTTVAEDDYEKYFYFHRSETDFETAFADVTECDAISSGSSIYMGVDAGQMGANMAQYGLLAGAVGGAVASLMADAIFGSAERRKQRRLNVRNCMHFKGYDRYGLAKDLWQEFHFEEGLSKTDTEEREEKLMMQARVASGPAPTTERLNP